MSDVDAASVTEEPEVQSEQEKLKHLDFVDGAVQQAVGYASKVYDYAKDKTGSFKPGVEKLEGNFKTVVGPAYDKLQGVHVEVLKFVDRKVDEVLPSSVKDATTTAKTLSANVVSDVKNNGVVGTAKELLVKIDPVAEEYASSAWKTLNNLPLVTRVAKAITPGATFVTEKYNQTVQQTVEKGYKVSSILPLVPTDKIARVFNIPEPKAEEPEPAVAPSGAEEAVEVVPRGEEEAVEEVAGGGEEAAGGGEIAVEET